MSMPLRISDDLVLKAREEAEVADRSLTAQIEHWVRLGMALEDVLGHREARELKRRGLHVPLEQAVAFAESAEGRAQVRAHLDARGTPRYEVDPERPGGVIRLEADGTRTRGRFVRRVFVAEDARTQP